MTLAIEHFYTERHTGRRFAVLDDCRLLEGATLLAGWTHGMFPAVACVGCGRKTMVRDSDWRPRHPSCPTHITEGRSA